jgi:hypothetical protein
MYVEDIKFVYKLIQKSTPKVPSYHQHVELLKSEEETQEIKAENVQVFAHDSAGVSFTSF